MMRKYGVGLAVLMSILAPVIARGGQLGEPAAPLAVKEWIKGQPVEVKAGTNIFVVEIFATTGLPSRASITNLNALQRRFRDKGVVVVGVSDEPAERIKDFLARAGVNVEYAIAADNERQTSLGYMVPVQQRGVPHAFVVGKDGRLLWHGHPLQGMDAALEEITAGRYNVDQVVKAETARMQLAQYLALARKGDPRAGEGGRRLLSLRTNDVLQLCELAFAIATDPKVKNREDPLASQALDRAE